MHETASGSIPHDELGPDDAETILGITAFAGIWLVIYGGGQSQAAPAYGYSAVMLFPVLAWMLASCVWVAFSTASMGGPGVAGEGRARMRRGGRPFDCNK